jgi:hypothetical protein
MADPGEVNQNIGRAYLEVFIASLERSIPGFENKFQVYNEPEKTTFKARSQREFSFDFGGIYRQEFRSFEVFGESKGYSKARNLLDEYRLFLAKAYVTSTDYKRHRQDHFWFVTNVPFACSEGSGVRSWQFLQATLKDKSNLKVAEILGDGHVDDSFLFELVSRIGVFILTDSYLMNTVLLYKVKPGDTLWSILKRMHGGPPPLGFGRLAKKIANENNLESPDRIRSGQRIRLNWPGMAAGRSDPQSF